MQILNTFLPLDHSELNSPVFLWNLAKDNRSSSVLRVF